MQIIICYKEGHTPVSAKCKVYGFGNPPPTIEKGWVKYAIYELADVQNKLIPALFEELAEYGVSYKDATFASIIPESADVVATAIRIILERSDFLEIPYKSLTHQRAQNAWIEISRRLIPAQAIKES